MEISMLMDSNFQPVLIFWLHALLIG